LPTTRHYASEEGGSSGAPEPAVEAQQSFGAPPQRVVGSSEWWDGLMRIEPLTELLGGGSTGGQRDADATLGFPFPGRFTALDETRKRDD
jgi:hypothetical protein